MRFYQYSSYKYYFYSLIKICIIAFIDVDTKLNNNIIQCSDPEFMYKIKPLQSHCHIIQYSNIFFQSEIGF